MAWRNHTKDDIHVVFFTGGYEISLLFLASFPPPPLLETTAFVIIPLIDKTRATSTLEPYKNTQRYSSREKESKSIKGRKMNGPTEISRTGPTHLLLVTQHMLRHTPLPALNQINRSI